jgi:hypothetical protein
MEPALSSLAPSGNTVILGQTKVKTQEIMARLINSRLAWSWNNVAPRSDYVDLIGRKERIMIAHHVQTKNNIES